MTDEDPPSTIPAMLRSIAKQRADHPAIVTARETLTYSDLDQRSARFAMALLSAGAGKGTRIALLAPDGIFWVTAFLGALRIGALLTTVSTLSAPPELAHVLRYSDCQHLIASRRFLNRDYAATLEAALPGLGEGRADRLALPDAPYFRSVWMDDATGLAWARPAEELFEMADGPDAPSPELLASAEDEVSPADDAVVVYTSGSTARPKAVVHRHWALSRHSRVLADQFALTPDDRMMPLLPAFWMAGMSMMLQVLSIGATLVYPDEPDNEHILDLIGQCGVTRVNAWGDRQVQLIRTAKERGMNLDHIPDLVAQTDANGNVLPLVPPSYGMTESCSAHSATPMNVALPEDKAGSYGVAIGGYERRVVDPETGRELPPGEVGELQIRGPALMSGFYKVGHDKVFTPDGFYPTKDLVRIDEDGYLYPAGRISDMIKTRAANVSRLEVEDALNALPDVEMSVVAGLRDEELGEIVVAAVVPEVGSCPNEESLRAALRGKISSFKIPRHIVFIEADDIPRTATGKVRLADTAAMIQVWLGEESV